MRILVISGANLNMLGCRNKDIYGVFTLEELYKKLIDKFEMVDFTFYQSNTEGDLINMIHQANEYDAIIINPGAYTHTSIAIRDALEIVNIPKVEVHLSNIYSREDFRKTDYIKDVCNACFYGEKELSYYKAVEFCILKKH